MLHILSVCLLFVTTFAFDFDHPKDPTFFSWSVDTWCLQRCELNVTDKNSGESMNFLPNKKYLSCDYPDDYEWNINCNTTECDVHDPKLLLFKYPLQTYYATTKPKTNSSFFEGILQIKIPECETVKDGDCLFIDISFEYAVTYYENPLVRFYGKNNFKCNQSYLMDDKFLVPIQRNREPHGFKYNVKFKLGCYSSKYHNFDAISLGDSYYLHLNSRNTDIKYYIGSDTISTSAQFDKSSDTYRISFWISIVVIVVISIIFVIVYKYCKNQSARYTEVQLEN
jgi:hypothetical protein